MENQDQNTSTLQDGTVLDMISEMHVRINLLNNQLLNNALLLEFLYTELEESELELDLDKYPEFAKAKLEEIRDMASKNDGAMKKVEEELREELQKQKEMIAQSVIQGV